MNTFQVGNQYRVGSCIFSESQTWLQLPLQCALLIQPTGLDPEMNLFSFMQHLTSPTNSSCWQLFYSPISPLPTSFHISVGSCIFSESQTWLQLPLQCALLIQPKGLDPEMDLFSFMQHLTSPTNSSCWQLFYSPILPLPTSFHMSVHHPHK
jgi:hypothetical protein